MQSHPEHSIYATDKSYAIGISITFFLVQTLCAVSFGIWGMAQLSQDSIAINLAGRQRMLTQRLAKTLLELDYAYQNNADTARSKQELTQTYQQFEQTLNALNKQTIVNRDGKTLFLTDNETERAKSLVSQAQLLWKPLHLALAPLVYSTSKPPPAVLTTAVKIVIRDNSSLLTLMNNLTNEIEDSLHKKSEWLSRIEILAIGLILINFGFILYYFHRQINQLAEHKLLLRNIMQYLGTAIIVLDRKGIIQLCNPATEKLFEYAPTELIGMSMQDLLVKPFHAQIGMRASGTRFALEIDLTEMTGTPERRLFIASLHDLSEQVQREKHLRHLAHHDPLTGLPNRLLFLDRLAQTVARAHRHNNGIGLLYIDLDHFKQINDKLGHATGDLLLQQTALRLLTCIRETDTVTRLGGDEFSIIIDSPDVNSYLAITNKILNEMNTEFILNNHPVQISASIGLSLYPQDNEEGNIDALLLYADIAMYRAKAMGGNTCCSYSEPVINTQPCLI